MQHQVKIEDSGVCPSFSCYSSDSLTSTAAAKVIREGQGARSDDFGDVDEEEFEFSFVSSDEEVSAKDIDSRGWTVFPVFNGDLLVKHEVDRDIKTKEDENDVSASITDPLRKLFIGEGDECSSYFSSEADESGSLLSGTYCVWRPKADGGTSPLITRFKSSSSARSGSKRWRIWQLLGRSNSERRELPMMLLNAKKVDSPKQKPNSDEISKVTGRLKVQTPLHQQIYVQRRAENEVSKRKSYLPYRQDLIGFFANGKGTGQLLPLR